MKKFLLIAVLFLGLAYANNAQGQKVAVKTNLLYDATSSMNLGLEFGLAPKWTLDISGNFNPWVFSNGKRWQHWFVQPELRWWTCNRFAGHFFAVNGAYGEADIAHVKFFDFWGGNQNFDKFRYHRYDGWFWQVGLAYGYAWAFAKHWNLEFEIGVGYVQNIHDKYGANYHGHTAKYGPDDPTWEWTKDAQHLLSDSKSNGTGKYYKHHKYYIGPTKAAINLVYVF